MKANENVNYEGIYWKDIKWNKPIHEMKTCDYCGSDGAEGHQNACYYLLKNQHTPAAQTFLRDRIKEALQREIDAKVDSKKNKKNKP